ncbi:leucyl/phenylalanyl-tRNA--protein transferase [Ferrigenium kumadai]|uniref:Leucyl/phenylalanyl-tRNA--protein transferase n=1 Tax=Ferrigenium kumadai TaxID=1682490 RepID=A0AAN1T0Z0_9PROT|nr:leucyl/phenylalanyl-tRNA--protein transferase [Ferrigenium kumadai]BBJ00232.1 leucyl/phenylalanyl-tRNA--protein transferase [Ferrigenium kumadai]
MIPWLTDSTDFPPVELALRSPNGLLAAGGDLSVPRLLSAYRHGIFPWFNPDEPILWWSPDPRMVLIPSEFKISRSLGRILRNGRHEVRFDTAFEQVMRACAAPREGASGTWIHDEMIAAYCALHELGYAHSVETWVDGELAGGLYGMGIGRMFYGESMFSRRTDASKIALAHLTRQLDRWQFGMIDCQMNTPHLASLGAREIPRAEFIARLQELIHCEPVTNWEFDPDLFR